MARQVHQREDLLRDATALEPRIELFRTDRQATLFAGFRGACLSVYFGEDPVFHFNAAGELRRAYIDGRLFKASGGALTAMRRVQSTSTSVLNSSELDGEETHKLLANMDQLLTELASDLSDSNYETVGQVPPNGDVLRQLIDWLASRPVPSIAASPRVD